MGRRWPSSGIAVRRELARDFCGSNDAPSAAKPAIPLLTLRWTLSAKRACVVITDSEPDRLAPLPRQRLSASAGFGWWRRAIAPALRRAVAPARVRGVLHVQAQTCAKRKGTICIQRPRE